jgi:lipocalin
MKYETIWILSRQPTIDQTLFNKLVSYYKSNGVPVEIFIKTDQTDCVYV